MPTTKPASRPSPGPSRRSIMQVSDRLLARLASENRNKFLEFRARPDSEPLLALALMQGGGVLAPDAPFFLSEWRDSLKDMSDKGWHLTITPLAGTDSTNPIAYRGLCVTIVLYDEWARPIQSQTLWLRNCDHRGLPGHWHPDVAVSGAIPPLTDRDSRYLHGHGQIALRIGAWRLVARVLGLGAGIYRHD